MPAIFLRNILLVLLLSLVSSKGIPSQAQGLEIDNEIILEKEYEKLQIRMSAFDAFMSEQDFRKSKDFLPPSLWDVQVAEFGKSEGEYISMLEASFRLVSEKVRINSYDFELSPSVIKQSVNGRKYALIPTTLNATHLSQTIDIVSESETLALVENDRWYIVSVSKPHDLERLLKAYPDLSDVKPMKTQIKINGKRIQQ